MNLEKLSWFLVRARNLSAYNLTAEEIHKWMIEFNNLSDQKINELLEEHFPMSWKNRERID